MVGAEAMSDDEFEFPFAVGSGPLLIDINYEVLDVGDFDDAVDYDVYVLKEGAELATALFEHLPGNIADAMLMTLLELKASTLRTRHSSPIVPSEPATQ